MDIHRARFVPFPPSAINALAFSHTPRDNKTEDPETLRLAVGRANGNIEIWNPAGGKWIQEKVFQGGKDRSVEGLVWIQEKDQEDERGNIIPGRLRLFSIGYSSSVTEWDLMTGLPIRHSSGNHSEIWCFAAQPRFDAPKKNKEEHGKAHTQNLVAGCADGTLVLLTTVDDDLRFDKFLSRPSAKKARVLSVVYKDRFTVLAGSADSTIRAFDTRNGSTIRSISLGSGPKGGPKDILVWKIKCLPSGDFVSGDSTGDLRFYDGKNYSQIQRISGHEADVLDLAVSRDGTFLYSGGMDCRTSVYTCGRKLSQGQRKHGREPWRKLSHKKYHDHDVKAMAIYDGKGPSVLVSGGVDTQPIIVPVREFGKELSRALPMLPSSPPLASAPGARLLVSWWNCELRIWRVKRQQETTEKPKMVARLALRGDENISSATVSADGRLLAAASASGVKLFQLTKSKLDAPPGLRIRRLELPPIPNAKLVKFSPDGKWLAIISHDDQTLLARTMFPGEDSERPHIVPRVLRLARIRRPSGPHDALHYANGAYDRSIIHAEFSHDGSAFAVADLAGYIDTWIVEGREDMSPKINGFEPTAADNDESDPEEDAEEQVVKIMGQRWVRNPSGHLLPRVDSTPLLLSFEPISRDAPRQNPTPQRNEVRSTEQRVLVVTAQHSIYEFEVLAGRLSEWTRRNPHSTYPPAFRSLDNTVKGCVWDVNDQYRRVWLYGEKWLFMFDLCQDLPFSEPASNSTPGPKKRKREGMKDTPRRGMSGAGDVVPERERHIPKIRKLVGGEADDASGAKWIDLNTSTKPELEEQSGDQHALATLRRTAGKDGERANGQTAGEETQLIMKEEVDQVKTRDSVASRDSWWHSFKYRPILGMVPIGKDAQSLEVVLVERPLWDIELPSKFVATFE